MSPVAQTRFPTSTPGATLCKKEGFRAVSNVQTSPHAAIPLTSASVALQITLQPRCPHRQSTTWMQPFSLRSAHPDYTLQPRPSHDKRGSPPSTPGATLCEKTRGFVRFQSSEPHLDAANPLPSASVALQITLQPRCPHRQSTTWMQPFSLRSAHPDYTLQWRTRPGETEHEPRPSHDKRGSPPPTPGATLCEKTRGFVRFQSSEPHLDAANPLPSASIALQIT